MASLRPGLGLAAFLSGAAALLFETLWFRQASLAFGNSVWAASLVLAAFMLGLGLGSALAARHGRRLVDPARAYAALEVVVGVSGLALALGLPQLAPLIATTLRSMLDNVLALAVARFALSGLLLALPATAMGATLPLLVKASIESDASLGSALGRLYGWNTLGAVVGALAGEGFLFELFGLSGAGAAAALLNGGAAAVALVASRRGRGARVELAPEEARVGLALPRASARLLAGAALCGASLLALEVLWFRFLMLFVQGTSLAFAVMLAVVLAGIALGGFVGSGLLKRNADAHRLLPALAWLAAAVSVAAYTLFRHAADRAPGHVADLGSVVFLSLPLMFPVSFLSGILFTLLGRALQEETGEAARSVGMLTMANTLGAASGSLLASLVLLPELGLERSFFALAVAYAASGLLLGPLVPAARARGLAAGAALVCLSALALFPFGLMERRYLGEVVRRFSADGSRLIASREGLTETILYFQRDFLGSALSHRLVTNGYSMSGTEWGSRRYMALFAHLPLALQAEPRRALLICYGVGTTARSLSAHRELAQIDVVDVSRAILDMGRLASAPGTPDVLADPRVRVRVEDGRFFLQVTQTRYDLITGEPPPPKYAGVVNLYTREYFTLVRDRLTDTGMASYWLPVWLLEKDDARAIVRAFCDSFKDCTLWTGAGLNWMLVGTRGGAVPVSEPTIRRLWTEPAVAAELVGLGIDGPAALGATFLGDSAFLADWARNALPVEDDRPTRLSNRIPDPGRPDASFVEATEALPARDRFERSAWVRRVWPAGLREQTRAAFDAQAAITRALVPDQRAWFLKLADRDDAGPALGRLLLLGSTPDEQDLAARALAEGSTASLALYHQALRDLAEGDPGAAERRLTEVQARNPGLERIAQLRALALCRAGRSAEAGQLGAAWLSGEAGVKPERPFWEWLGERCAGAAPRPSR